MASAGNITAVLRLNATPFKDSLKSSESAVATFSKSITQIATESNRVQSAVELLEKSLAQTKTVIEQFNLTVGSLKNFTSYAQAVNRLANALKILSSDAVNVDRSMNILNNMFKMFKDSLNGAEIKVKGFVLTEKQLQASNQQLGTSFKTVKQNLLDMGMGINRYSADMLKLSESEAQAKYYTQMLRKEYGLTGEKLAQVRSQLMQTTNAMRQYDSALTITQSKQNQTSNSSSRLSSSLQRQSVANRTATASTNQLTTATSRLGKAMSSLRMMGSLVGSMLAYNFAHKLLVATGETIHAKSEMEGYFKMLNFGQGEINSFNSALDRTVAQFQRVNKYSLGETISSIGVEFNLSTKEMEKAMKVTSMITSEYLRAGRNANEASLAVKDVLQGQFQRLSRETGVKGEQLKEAGWSGDTTDVLGLMKALEKVGHDRNWDVFAEKANSLNDILTILQNRFGEWSADLVYSVQPAIVGAFNMIMESAQKLAGVFNSVWQWLNGDGIDSNIAKWGLLATAITTVLGVLVAYRTGAGLLQVAQIGLTRTLASTVLGLNAEQVALYGTRTAIMSKIFGLEAEKVATLSTRDAILSKILGLDAEVVAQSTLRQGILDKAFAQELETLRLSGATKEEMLNTLALYENQLAQKSTIGLLSAQAMGLNMTTYATHGFTVALIESKTGMKASEIASMGLAKKIALLGTSFVLPTAIVTGFVAVLVMLALQMNESAKEMERFNDILENGENVVKENRETVQHYTDQQAKLQEQLAKTKEGTAEYFAIQNELRNTNQALITSNENLENSYKALQVARSSQAHYEQRLTEMNIEHQGRLAQAYMNAGYTAQEAYEMANTSLLDAQAGAEQLRETLQKIAVLQWKGEANVSAMLGEFEENNVDPEKQKPYLDKAVSLNDKMQKAMEKGMTDESFMGRMDGWLSYYQYQIENWINNVGAMLETNDWGAIWDNIWRGIAHGFADLPILKDFWGWIFKQTGITNLKGKGWDFLDSITGGFADDLLGGHTLLGDLNWLGEQLNSFGDLWNNFWNNLDLAGAVNDAWQGFSDWVQSIDIGKMISDFFGDGESSGLMKIDLIGLMSKIFDFADTLGLTQWLQDSVITPLTEAWNGFLADPLSYIGGALSTIGMGGFISALMGMTDGMDFSWAWDFVNNNIILPITFTLQTFMANPIAFIGDMGFTLTGLLDGIFGTDIFSQVFNWVNVSIIQPFGSAIYNGIMSIPILSDVLTMLGFTDQASPTASAKGKALADSFQKAVEDKIRNIPILGDILQMLGVIPQANPDAHDKGHGVGQNIKDGEKQGHTGTAQNVASEMDDVIGAITGAIQGAFDSAQKVGSAIWNGINSVLQRASPGFIHDQVLLEFGTDIPNAIASSGDTAYSTAQTYGQMISDGISSVNLNTSQFGGMVDTYQTDAQIVTDSSQMMGMTTTTAFNDMAYAVNTTTAQMGANVGTTYTSMQTKQATLLNSMKQKNSTAYNEMYTKSNTSLIQMRDSTSNITHQMTNAWNTMKNNIVASADRLKKDSTVHFNTLSNTIGGFYRKIQNPSSWGGSPHGGSTHRNVSAGNRIASAFRTGGVKYSGGRGSTYTGDRTMTIAQLKKKICPNGDCNGIFDGWSSTDVVDVRTFLSMIDEGGFGSWSDWNGTHYNYIKNKSDAWSMKSPTINLKGGIPTNANYKVGDFENGTPKISFASFQSMAESIFTAIPYRFYYNSEWKGSWLGALQAGACNCWDGAHAILAFARSCGFDGGIQHGTWVDPDGTSYPHVFAVINGKKMDTTGWQQRGSWSAGSPNIRGANSPKPNNNNQQSVVNVSVTIEGDVYGVDDLDSKIADGVDKGLAEHFNKSYTIGAI